MKVLAVCGFGVGSSMILKMSLDKIFSKLGVEVEVVNTDINDCRSLPCDAIFTSAELADEIKNSVNVPVYPVVKYMDLTEIEEVARKFLNK